MKVGPFMLALGIAEIKEVPQEAVDAICEAVQDAVYAGVTPTVGEWTSMSEVEQAAFLEANDKMWRERCSLTGEASQSLVAAAYIRNKEEGDDLMAQEVVNFMVRKNIGKLEKEKSTSNR